MQLSNRRSPVIHILSKQQLSLAILLVQFLFKHIVVVLKGFYLFFHPFQRFFVSIKVKLQGIAISKLFVDHFLFQSSNLIQEHLLILVHDLAVVIHLLVQSLDNIDVILERLFNLQGLFILQLILILKHIGSPHLGLLRAFQHLEPRNNLVVNRILNILNLVVQRLSVLQANAT
jgi:hypothetical protein